ncbi:MoxR family ATPase [Methylotenera sp.]|uniref:AAA family ATPase n=1 Tax=Methylotenera sp. TaxID=2051956 RepID=UPI00272FF486|nr:MoxR family ATPase [Methylotenera sp.]MDP2072340.1 MoxR family ATPase [Methylotenera sp.]MDP2231095.1 MoxR family ATPase [Methylotenera sp.]MDP3005139.1 MoxR family ATPase [Methylotenera sp.]MDP3140227.1 MoxR family ATPase [Methylotenera sp.]MDZ4211354.1 MoxR family ATPase [Methylotenera sp.]
MKNVTDAIIAKTNEVILGKEQQIKLALACILAKGHLLIEDLPGMGKTTLAHTLAQVLGLQFQRVQFTSDLLPADVLGVSVYDRNTANFKFHPGPVFTNVLLADEINRATPKTQSALLEVMEEAQVTIDAVTYTLPQPFFVIATQNPSSQIGTFALPESQLDRFLMRITLNYPDTASERKLLQSNGGREQLAKLSAVIDSKQLQALQAASHEVHVSDALLDYLQAILQHTRQSAHFNAGLSPRAGLSLKQCAQAWAMLAGRDHVIPEDIQAILPSVAGHRLVSNNTLTSNADNIAQLLKAVAV